MPGSPPVTYPTGHGEDPMYAAASSGGKDSTLALHEALRQGFAVTHILHVHSTETSRVRFHGYKPELVAMQAECMGLQIIVEPTRAEQFDQDFEAALRKVTDTGLKGLIFGNLFLEDVREFYQTRVERAGLDYHDVLWKRPTQDVLRDFVELGFRAIVTSVWLDRLDRSYLGRNIDVEFSRDIGAEQGVDPCGENGEYHTLVYDGPCFLKPLPFKTYGVHEESNNVFLDVRTD